MIIGVKAYEMTDAQNGMKGLATVTFGDSFKVRSIAIVEGKEGKPFVAMPCYKSKEKDDSGNPVYKEICNPITKEFREELYSAILDSMMSGQEVIIGTDDGRKQPEYGIRVTPFVSDSSTKGLAKIYLEDAFVINNVVIKESKAGELFMSMPSYKSNKLDQDGKPEYKDICYPATKEFRKELSEAILAAYKEAKSPEKENDNPFVEGKEPNEIKEPSQKNTEKKAEKTSIKDKLADGKTKKQEKAAEPKSKTPDKAEPVLA